MSLTKFYFGTTSDLSDKDYEEGAVYFCFPEETSTSLGHIYLDKEGYRREISSAYNDSSLIARIAELERVSIVHCEGITLSSTVEQKLSTDGSGALSAMISPVGTTDLVTWTSSDSNVATIESFTYNIETGETSAIVVPHGAGSCSINISCGQHNASYSLSVVNEQWFIGYLLAEDYSPNGDSFSYTAPLTLQNSQYIEAKIDLNGVNTIKQNLLSIGQDIDKFTDSRTPKIHIYSSQTIANLKTHLRLAVIYTSNKSGIEYPIPNINGTEVIIRLDYDGLWINGEAFAPLDNTARSIYESIIEAFRGKSSFEVGSLEGVNRSTAYYEYIKYVKYEPTI